MHILVGRFVITAVCDTLIFNDDNLYLTLMFLDDLVHEKYFSNLKMKILVKNLRCYNLVSKPCFKGFG